MNHENPVNTATLTAHSLHVQNRNGSQREHICDWPRSESGMVDPAALIDDATHQLKLAGWQLNHGWAYWPIKSDGLWVSIRPIPETKEYM